MSPSSAVYTHNAIKAFQLSVLQYQLAMQYVIKLKSNKQNPAYDIFHWDEPLVDYISDDELSEEEEEGGVPKRKETAKRDEKISPFEILWNSPRRRCYEWHPFLTSYLIKKLLKLSYGLSKDLRLITC